MRSNTPSKTFLKIGLTGGIGSGKTTVSKIIEALGFPVFYSDLEAKKLMTNNPNVVAAVKSLFGTEAYANGDLNRTYLAQVVFNNPSLLKALNDIIHPEVRNAFEDFCMKNKTKKLIFNEAAILFETGAYKTFDFNVLVTAREELRIERVAKRDQISENQVRERMNNQWSDDRKLSLADFVIVNDNQELITQVERVVSNLLSKLD